MSDWMQNPQEPLNGTNPSADTPTAPENTEPPISPAPTVPDDGGNTVPPVTPPMPPRQEYTWTPNPTPQPPMPSYGWGAPPPAPPKKHKKLSGSAIAITVLAVLCAVCLFTSTVLVVKHLGDSDIGPSQTPGISGGNVSGSQSGGNTAAPSLETKQPESEGLTDREIVNANLNSTVIIRMYTVSSNRYFGQSSEETQASEATGIVWTADGYIITNAHVVYNDSTSTLYDRIEVQTYNGTVFESAEVVGYDTTTDLAVIKVDATDLTPAVFGDSEALCMGDRVLALGNNSGLGWTVTGGMISGLTRDVYEQTSYAIKCLQVDAVINPGNSGGPLLNTSGQVIGINSAKIVAEGYEGLGFSIPINEAKDILQDLVTHGYVKGRIMLGIEGYTFNQYSGYEGFYISDIKSPSSFSGTAVQAGDIITHINGVRVESYAEMREQITTYAVGDEVTVTLIRFSRNSRTAEKFDVTITLLESDGSV